MVVIDVRRVIGCNVACLPRHAYLISGLVGASLLDGESVEVDFSGIEYVGERFFYSSLFHHFFNKCLKVRGLDGLLSGISRVPDWVYSVI